MVLNEVGLQSLRRWNSKETGSIKQADLLNVNWPALFVDAMIAVWVELLYKFIFLIDKIYDVVDIVIFAPLRMVLHHYLYILNNKFSCTAEPK